MRRWCSIRRGGGGGSSAAERSPSSRTACFSKYQDSPGPSKLAGFLYREINFFLSFNFKIGLLWAYLQQCECKGTTRDGDKIE